MYTVRQNQIASRTIQMQLVLTSEQTVSHYATSSAADLQDGPGEPQHTRRPGPTTLLPFVSTHPRLTTIPQVPDTWARCRELETKLEGNVTATSVLSQQYLKVTISECPLVAIYDQAPFLVLQPTSSTA